MKTGDCLLQVHKGEIPKRFNYHFKWKELLLNLMPGDYVIVNYIKTAAIKRASYALHKQITTRRISKRKALIKVLY